MASKSVKYCSLRLVRQAGAPAARGEGGKICLVKADFHSRISGARATLRLIVDLGMRTYNRKARESDRAIAKKS